TVSGRDDIIVPDPEGMPGERQEPGEILPIFRSGSAVPKPGLALIRLVASIARSPRTLPDRQLAQQPRKRRFQLVTHIVYDLRRRKSHSQQCIRARGST